MPRKCAPDLEAVRRESQRMVTAWLVLDRAATAAGKGPLSPLVWEVALPDGSVAPSCQVTSITARDH